MRTCAVCFHFRRDPMAFREGECRRNPPQAFLTHDGEGKATFTSVWPSVEEQDRCGEFSHKALAHLQRQAEAVQDA